MFRKVNGESMVFNESTVTESDFDGKNMHCSGNLTV